MVRFAARRLVFGVFLVFAVSSMSLILARLAPGDYVIDSRGIAASSETAARARARYGLDTSIGAQYGRWLYDAARFDFGRSLAYDRPVSDLVPERAANTALLAVTALVLAIVVGLPLGILSGSRHRGLVPGIVRTGSLILLSLPPLLTSLLLVFTAARTGWFPIGGMRSAVTGSPGFLDVLKHMVVPVIALALPIAATLERIQAQAMTESIGQPFVLAAFARGVPRHRVVWRDALKASLRPVASVSGLVIASLFSGSFAVEMVTAWPGLGRLMLDALRARDIYLVAGCAAAGSIFLAFGTLLSDTAVALVDPRTRE